MSPHLVKPVANSEGPSVERQTSAEREIGRSRICGLGEDGGVDSGQARAPVVAPRPTGPTKADLAAHEPLHLEYRSWCPSCVFGRGHSAHHRSDGTAIVDATWHMEYCFFSENGELKEEEEEAKDRATVLVTYDELKEAFWAMPVERQGPAPGVAKWCVDKLEDSGY